MKYMLLLRGNGLLRHWELTDDDGKKLPTLQGWRRTLKSYIFTFSEPVRLVGGRTLAPFHFVGEPIQYRVQVPLAAVLTPIESDETSKPFEVDWSLAPSDCEGWKISYDRATGLWFCEARYVDATTLSYLRDNKRRMQVKVSSGGFREAPTFGWQPGDPLGVMRPFPVESF